jgi:uncharacterized protein
VVKGTVRGPLPVEIHYLRPPDMPTVYRQVLVHDDGRVKATLARGLTFSSPLLIEDEVALEEGSDALWFTFPGAWHDIGLFHRGDGTLTGLYANIITPCLFSPGGVWHTTDLFLDLWIPAEEGRPTWLNPPEGPEPRVLDAEELQRAREKGLVRAAWARRAWQEIRRLQRGFQGGSWPPQVVREWSLERAQDIALEDYSSRT